MMNSSVNIVMLLIIVQRFHRRCQCGAAMNTEKKNLFMDVSCFLCQHLNVTEVNISGADLYELCPICSRAVFVHLSII